MTTETRYHGLVSFTPVTSVKMDISRDTLISMTRNSGRSNKCLAEKITVTSKSQEGRNFATETSDDVINALGG